MDVDLFDFELPEANIALRPAVPRDASRLLVVGPDGLIEDRVFTNLVDYLDEGDALVFNDTRVLPAQFFGIRKRDENFAQVSVTLHRRISANQWAAFVKGAKKLQIGDHLLLSNQDVALERIAEHSFKHGLAALVTNKGEGGEVELEFALSGPQLDDAMMDQGEMPLPPYIASKREQDSQDLEDYQTIYAKRDGAVAAPTAGLHFTDQVFDQLAEKGVTCHFCTLHVGAGTFIPVKVEDTDDHKMHFENGFVSAQTAEALNKVRENGGRIVSVGTTSLRLLESAVDEDGVFHAWDGATDIFITPGYQFRGIDLLVTNFHLPRSTLFMLVSAFSGLETMKNAYKHAIDQQYRFYSYGDSSLLFPGETKL